MTTLFTIDINFAITDVQNPSVEGSEGTLDVSFTLSNTLSGLENDYLGNFLVTAWYANLTPSMNESAVQTQMKANFVTLAQFVIEEFAELAKRKIQSDLGSAVEETLTGTIDDVPVVEAQSVVNKNISLVDGNFIRVTWS